MFRRLVQLPLVRKIEEIQFIHIICTTLNIQVSTSNKSNIPSDFFFHDTSIISFHIGYIVIFISVPLKEKKMKQLTNHYRSSP